MKFQVRDGFTCRLQTIIDLGNGQTELRESPAYPGQFIDLPAEQAASYAHQLEPRDDEASAWMDAQHLKVTAPEPLGLSADQVQAIALLLARHLAIAPGETASSLKA